MPSPLSAPLPRVRPKPIKSGLSHAVSPAGMAFAVARSRYTRIQFHPGLNRADNETALLKEELAITDARWGQSEICIFARDRFRVKLNTGSVHFASCSTSPD